MIVIERACREDVPEIRSVLGSTWRATYGLFLPSGVIDAITKELHAPEVLLREVEDPDLWFAVAKEQERIIGLVTAHRQEDAIVINRLYVLPACQRRGIGEELMESVRTACPTATRLQLEVEVQNEIGLAFYRKQGFREVGRRDVTIGDVTLNVLELEKPLTGV